MTPPRAADVGCQLKAQGLRASITQHAANVEGELKRFVAKYVAREIEKPYVVKARTIDVSGAIDKAVGNLAPRYGQSEELHLRPGRCARGRDPRARRACSTDETLADRRATKQA